MNEQLTPEVENYIRQMQEQVDVERKRNITNAKTQYNQLLFKDDHQENLIKYQLDLKEELNRIYRLLKGDVLKQDEEGNLTYHEADDPELRPFNEFGVQILMNTLSFYLNRNVLLSNYDDETINKKVLKLGRDLNDLIHNRYEDMMTTIEQEAGEEEEAFRTRLRDHLQQKLKLYPIIVTEITDAIHSAYLRAFRGLERESLKTARIVTEDVSRNQTQTPQNIQQQKSKWSWIPFVK